MRRMKTKKGHNGVVMSGQAKGRSGGVVRVYPSESRLIVQGVHMARRHTKPRMGDPGGIVEKERTIRVSNVAHVVPQSRKPKRVRYKVLVGGRQLRFARRSSEITGKRPTT